MVDWTGGLHIMKDVEIVDRTRVFFGSFHVRQPGGGGDRKEGYR